MKTLFAILCTVVTINAARTSQWSASFMLKDPALGSQNQLASSTSHALLAIRVLPQSQKLVASFFLSGIESQETSSLCIYNLNGKMVADLSGSLHAGESHLDWKIPQNASGMLFAQLRDRKSIKTIQFAIYR